MPTLADIDGVAGLAALINGLILWPLVRSLKKDHGERITALEAAVPAKRVPKKVPTVPTAKSRKGRAGRWH